MEATIEENLQSLKHFRSLHDVLFKPSKEITEMVYQVALISGHEDILLSEEFSHRLAESTTKTSSKRLVKKLVQSLDNDKLGVLLDNHGSIDHMISSEAVAFEVMMSRPIKKLNIEMINYILSKLKYNPLKVYLTIVHLNVTFLEHLHDWLSSLIIYELSGCPEMMCNKHRGKFYYPSFECVECSEELRIAKLKAESGLPSKCRYILKRGENHGKPCGRSTILGHDRCRTCSMKR